LIANFLICEFKSTKPESMSNGDKLKRSAANLSIERSLKKKIVKRLEKKIILLQSITATK
jgi:hypothetical protein